VPLPLPDEAPVIVTQGVVLAAVQEQTFEVVIVTRPLPPDAGKICPLGLTAYAQADWVALTVIPATVNAALRAGPG